jgi:hypothetical protein
MDEVVHDHSFVFNVQIFRSFPTNICSPGRDGSLSTEELGNMFWTKIRMVAFLSLFLVTSAAIGSPLGRFGLLTHANFNTLPLQAWNYAKAPDGESLQNAQSVDSIGIKAAQNNQQTVKLKKKNSQVSWWLFPAVAMVLAYTTFPSISRNFHRLVQWMSNDAWLPDTPDKMTLLSNVITQVVNGPVVTSISVLFATLVSVTIETLHSRQQDVQKSLINEFEALISLQSLLSSPLQSSCFREAEKQKFLEGVSSIQTVATAESVAEDMRPHSYSPCDFIAMGSDHVLLLCDQVELDARRHSRQQLPQLQLLLSRIRGLVENIRNERKTRWTAVMSMHFPLAHYLTLALLVSSILVAFLVTTDEADFIFLQGLQVRMLWSVLVTCFSSLAVVIADLSDAYSGVYTVSTDFTTRG